MRKFSRVLSYRDQKCRMLVSYLSLVGIHEHLKTSFSSQVKADNKFGERYDVCMKS